MTNPSPGRDHVAVAVDPIKITSDRLRVDMNIEILGEAEDGSLIVERSIVRARPPLQDRVLS